MDKAKVYFFFSQLCVYVCHSLGGIHPDGVSEVGHLQDDQGNYQFGYKVSDHEGEHFRREGTDANGAIIGSYGFTEADGRHRIVDYIADEHGFRAHVRTNEPGTAASNPAGVTIAKEGYAGPASHLDTAGTSVSSSSTKNPSKEHPERVFGVRLTPPASHHRNSDLDTPYERNNHPAYPAEADSTPVAEPKRVRPFPPTYSRDPGAYYPPLDPLPPSSSFPEYQPSRIPAVQSPPSQPHASVPDASRPYLPPYGGGYDPVYTNGYGDRNVINRRPDVSVTAIHGGYMRDPFSPRPRQHYGVPRGRDSLPRRPDYPSVHDDRIIVPTRNDIAVPSPNNPNLVLRAVPIPNGIQAVHVDSATGEVHRNVVYPAFDRQGRNFWDYDRNRGLFNTLPDRDYVNQDGYTTYGPSVYPDTDRRYVPGTRRRFSNVPYNTERPVYAGGGGIVRNRQPVTIPDDLNLSTPSARDLAGLPPYVRYGYDSDAGSYQGGVNYTPYLNSGHYDSTSRERYPSRYDVPDLYDPAFADQDDYDNGQNGFNPYFGALPSSPAANAYPDYQRAGLLAPQISKNEKVAKDSRQKSSVEFVDDSGKTH